MRELPLPTEAFLALSRFVRWPPGLAMVIMLEAALMILAWRGSLDRMLKNLIGANVVALLVLVPFWLLGISMPIVKIQQSLNK